MLARYMLSSCVCLHVSVSVCPSVRMSETSRYCFETTGRIQLVFAMEASFHLSYTVLQENSGIYVYPKIRVFFLESAVRKFRHGKSIVLSAKLMTFELVDHTYDGLRVVVVRVVAITTCIASIVMYDLLWICRRPAVCSCICAATSRQDFDRLGRRA